MVVHEIDAVDDILVHDKIGPLYLQTCIYSLCAVSTLDIEATVSTEILFDPFLHNCLFLARSSLKCGFLDSEDNAKLIVNKLSCCYFSIQVILFSLTVRSLLFLVFRQDLVDRHMLCLFEVVLSGSLFFHLMHKFLAYPWLFSLHLLLT